MAKYYLASRNDINFYNFVKSEGITPDPKTGVVPLSTSIDGAIERYLTDAQENAGIKPENIKALMVFEIELSALAPICEIEDMPPELKKYYNFIGYKGTLPPDFITDTFTVDLFDMDRKAGESFHVEDTLYFATFENDVDNVQKNGFTLSETLPEAPRGVLLTTNPYEAAALYATIYKTKERGITSLAVVSVCFPPYVNLQSDVDLTIPGAVEPIRTFVYDGKIPPEYMKGGYIMDLKPGGRFA